MSDRANMMNNLSATSQPTVAPYLASQGGIEFSLWHGNDPEPNASFQQMQYPDLTASVDDWAFQGVDTAFFGSIMSSGNLNFGMDEEVSSPMWGLPINPKVGDQYFRSPARASTN